MAAMRMLQVVLLLCNIWFNYLISNVYLYRCRWLIADLGRLRQTV